MLRLEYTTDLKKTRHHILADYTLVNGYRQKLGIIYYTHYQTFKLLRTQQIFFITTQNI